MIKMPQGSLPHDTIDYLKEKQDLIDRETEYANKVERGKALWKNKNRRHFKVICDVLEIMCVGQQRCSYCEDSAADEVEHIVPKDLYPDKVFEWLNYLFACGPCNVKKSSRFAVFDSSDSFVDVTRKKGEPVVAPLQGHKVFINPRIEDPLQFLMLDLQTLLFVAIPTLSASEQIRAEYTYEILGLNTRDYLIAARKEAFRSYLDSLELYIQRKRHGATQTELSHKADELNSRHHPTVWQEMKRWHEYYPHITELFQEAPELL